MHTRIRPNTFQLAESAEKPRAAAFSIARTFWHMRYTKYPVYMSN